MRLIDADALAVLVPDGGYVGSEWVSLIIRNAPTVDAEPVVRCGRCVHFLEGVREEQRSMNRATLVGRLASDPEVRTTQSGTNTCSFRIAVQRNYKNANGTYDADFLPVVCWRQSADYAGKYLHKGDMCAVDGAIRTRSYDGQDGQKRYVTEIVADRVMSLAPRRTDGAPAQSGDGFTEVDDTELPF